MAQLISWCDKLASTPTVGFRISPHYAPADTLIAALTPTLDALPLSDRPSFQFENLDALSVVLNTDEGFRYTLDAMRVAVQFNHRVRVRATSGGLPAMEMLSNPAPFTELLKRVEEKLSQVMKRVPNVAARRITRVFVVSTTAVAREDLPPGIERMIEHFTTPWAGELNSMTLAIRSILDKTDGHSDYCLHNISIPESTDELMGVTLDWHREFSPDRPISESAVASILSEGRVGALKYFEELADGSRFDAELITQG